jgi:hypothetical protein
MVLEGAAKAAAARIDAPGHEASPEASPGEVSVVLAPGSGDDAIVDVVRELPGRRVVVTADRELRARVVAAGASVLGPGWLLGLLPVPGRDKGLRATRPVQPGGPLPLLRRRIQAPERAS